MATLRADTTSQDGDIEDASVVTTSGTTMTCFTSSSADNNSQRIYWFFDTSSIPDGAVIDRAFFNFYVSARVTDVNLSYLFYQGAGNLGSTLDIPDWNGLPAMTLYTSYIAAPPPIGWNRHTLIPSLINKTGFTNIGAKAEAGTTVVGSFTVHTSENPSGNKGYLEVYYDTVGAGPNQYLLGGV